MFPDQIYGYPPFFQKFSEVRLRTISNTRAFHTPRLSLIMKSDLKDSPRLKVEVAFSRKSRVYSFYLDIQLAWKWSMVLFAE